MRAILLGADGYSWHETEIAAPPPQTYMVPIPPPRPDFGKPTDLRDVTITVRTFKLIAMGNGVVVYEEAWS